MTWLSIGIAPETRAKILVSKKSKSVKNRRANYLTSLDQIIAFLVHKDYKLMLHDLSNSLNFQKETKCLAYYKSARPAKQRDEKHHQWLDRFSITKMLLNMQNG